MNVKGLLEDYFFLIWGRVVYFASGTLEYDVSCRCTKRARPRSTDEYSDKRDF